MTPLTAAEQRARDEKIVAVWWEARDLLGFRGSSPIRAEMAWPMSESPHAREYTHEVDGVVLLTDLDRSYALSAIQRTDCFDMETLERKAPVPIFAKPGGGWP